MQMKVIVLLILLSLISPLGMVPVYGQETEEGPNRKRFDLEEVVIEGKEDRFDTIEERRESPHAKVIIGRKEIETFGDQRAGDVLKRLPGLFMGGPPGENKDVRLRGLDKEYTQILIDGERVSGGGEKREFDLDLIPADMIERIEIIRNPTAEHDHDVVGGIVNIILRKPPKELKVDGVIASGGQEGESLLDTRNFSLSLGNRVGRLRYQLGGSYLRTFKDKDRTKEKAGGDLEVEDEDKDRISNDLFLAFTFALTPQDDLTLRPFFLDANEEIDKRKETRKTTGGIDREDEHEEKEIQDPRVSLKWTHRFFSGARLELGGTFNRHEEEKDKTKTKSTLIGGGFVPTSTEFEKEEKEDQEWIADAKVRLPFLVWDHGHLLSFGGKYRDKDRTKRKTKEEVFTSGAVIDTTGPKDNHDLEEKIGALFISDEIEITDRLLVTPGFRAEFAEGEFFDIKTGGSGESRFTTLHPSAHLLYKLRPQTNLRGSFAKTMRRPKFDDLIPSKEEKSDQVKLGNPFLKPEESRNYETQIEQFWQGGFASIGGFYRQIHDKIEEVIIGIDPGTGKNLVEPVNVGEGRIFGAEFELEAKLAATGIWILKDFTFRGNVSWFDSAVRDPVTGEERKFKDQPDFVFNLILQYFYKPWGAGANVGWNYLDERIDVKNDGTKKIEAPVSLVDLSVRKALGKHLSLFFDVKNLLREEKVKVDAGLKEVESIPQVYFFGVRGHF